MLRALGLPPFAAALSFRPQHFQSPKTFSASFFFSSSSKSNWKNTPPSHFLLQTTAVRSSINGEQPDDSPAVQDGVAQDMDSYPNNLSREYDSVWDTKPFWCQPWTIVFTGVIVIASTWFWLHSAFISAAVSCLISAWWYIFLYAYPKVDIYDGGKTTKVGKGNS